MARLTLVIAPGGSASVRLIDRAGQDRALLIRRDDGPVSARVMNPYGKLLFEAP